MPTIKPNELSPKDRYRLMIDCVVPRPIAWVTTISEAGIENLAPFSYFMGVGSSPPSVAISIGPRTPAKDTLVNLRDTGEGVVHIVPPDHLDTVNQTGGDYARDVSEVETLGLPTTPSIEVAPPRLAFADVALECRLMKEVHIGSPGATLCILEVVLVHVSDDVAQSDGLPDPGKLRAVARLGERCYLKGDSWQVVERERPVVPDELSIRHD